MPTRDSGHNGFVPEMGEYLVATGPIGNHCPRGALGVVVRRPSGDDQPWPITVLWDERVCTHLMEQEMNNNTMALGVRAPLVGVYDWRGTTALTEDVGTGYFRKAFHVGRQRFPALVVMEDTGVRH